MSIVLKNCFRSTAINESTIEHPVRSAKTYAELQSRTVPYGVEEKLVEVEYPHTPERIKSYSDVADYKKDPLSAVANATPRQNLGDVRDFQKIQNMDTTELRALLDKTQNAIDLCRKKLAATESKEEPKEESKEEPKTEPKGGNV